MIGALVLYLLRRRRRQMLEVAGGVVLVAIAAVVLVPTLGFEGACPLLALGLVVALVHLVPASLDEDGAR